MEGVSNYLNLKKTDYAIQINGPWGIGKTYYVLNELRPFIESKVAAKVEDEEKYYQFRYVSLNGLKNVESIGERILFSNSEKFGVGYAITKSLLNSTTSFFKPFKALNDEAQKHFEEHAYKLLDKQTMVLCFDDFERIDKTLSVEEVLGYINTNFVEHNNVKTIIISNEDKVSDSKTFSEIKEKVINRTLTFDKPIVDTTSNMIGDVYEEEYLEHLRKYESFISKSILAANVDNLRTVRFVFDNYKIIFETIQKDFIQEAGLLERTDDIYNKLFIFALLVSNEYKLGKIDSIDSVSQLEFDSLGFIYNSRSLEDDGTPEYDVEFYDTYFSSEILKDNYQFFESIGKLVLEGKLLNEQLKEEIRKVFTNKNNESEKILRKLYSYRTLEEEELTKIVSDVIENIEAVNYSPVKLPTIFETLDEINRAGYVDIKLNDLKNTIKGIIKQSFDRHGEYIMDDRRFLRHFDENIQDENYREIVQMIKDIRKDLIEEYDLDEMKSFLTSLGTGQLLESMKAMEAKNHFFLVLNKTNFAQDLKNYRNKSILDFMSYLNDRYLRITNAADFHSHEVPEIQIFKRDINKSLSDCSDIKKLKRDNINELLDELDSVIKHLSRTSKD